MSGWDSPTGSWDSGSEPEGSGSDDQGYQQSQRTGGYRNVQGGEAVLRTGRRGLPGYDQAQGYDQAPGYAQAQGYDQAPGYAHGSGYGREPGYGTDSAYGQESGYRPQSGYGQDQGYGPQSGWGQQPGYEAGTTPASVMRYGQDPLASGPQSVSAPQAGLPVPRRAIGSGAQSTVGSGPQSTVGSGSQASPGYDQGSSGAYPAYNPAEGSRAPWPGVDDQYDQQGFGGQQASSRDHGHSDFGQPGYDQPGLDQRSYDQRGFDQRGYDPPDPRDPRDQGDYDQQGYGQAGHGQQDYDQPGFGTGRSRALGEPDQVYPGQGAQGYQTEAYPQQGFERPGYAQNGYADQGSGQGDYGQGGYGGRSAIGQPVAPGGPDYQPASPSNPGYHQDGYGQGSYAQDPYGHNGTQGTYAQDSYSGYGQEGYRQDAYGTGGYRPDAYSQPGYEQPPAGPPYGQDDFADPGRSPRSGSSRSAQRAPQRLGGIRMVLYLLSSVVGVVVIVLLVVHLTKAGTNSPSGASTPGTSTAPAGAAPVTELVLKAAPKAGPFALNTAATRTLTQGMRAGLASLQSVLKARGAGRASKDVVAVYDLGSVTDPSASDFKAVDFFGYDGTFNAAAVIKFEQTQLVSTRVVNAGPHGGEMICGYSRSNGADASSCFWVTKSTFGMLEFAVGGTPVKYNGASDIALTVRDAVEVPAS